MLWSANNLQLHMKTCCTGVFSAGVPAAFQANYLSAVQFLEGLEALCPTQEVSQACTLSVGLLGPLHVCTAHVPQDVVRLFMRLSVDLAAPLLLVLLS